MKITRLFTKQSSDPLNNIKFIRRNSKITKLDGTVVFENNNVIVPEDWSQIATDILAQKYFRKQGINQDNDGENDARQVFHRLAGCWRYWGEKYNYFDSHLDAQNFYDETIYMLAKQICAPNSPQWFNTGLHWAYNISGPAQGHSYIDYKTNKLSHSASAYERPQPHACFIQSVEDDLVNPGGIMDLFIREARIFKYGSGSGTNFSKIRGNEEALSGGGYSSGLMSFLSVGDRAAGAIKSGGTTRRAAKMVCLNLDHPDIEAFINWKVTEEHKVAMLATGSSILQQHWNKICETVENSVTKDCNPTSNKALNQALTNAKTSGIPSPFLAQCLDRLNHGDYSRNIANYNTNWDNDAYATVSGMNSNNSIRIPNNFMHILEKDGDWTLIRRTDNKPHKTLKASNLWQSINTATWTCADPGIQFDTTINDWHTCPEEGRINASNPCSEYMFLDDTACNLASLNLCAFLKDNGDFDLESYKHAIYIWTIILEISILMAQFPSERIAELSHKYRTLGLGYTNLGSMLMRMKIPYDSEIGTQWGAALASILTGTAYATSAQMAKQLGPFQGYETNKASMLRVIRNHRRAAYNAHETEYEHLSITPHGLHGKDLPDNILNTARMSWDLAIELGEKYGFRNAQVTLLAPTGTIGLLMDCDTTGIEPDFSLVKFKKLAGGGYFKIINKAIPIALKKMNYSTEQIQEIEEYVLGYLKITDRTPGITRKDFLEYGWTESELNNIEEKLTSAFDPTYVLPMERIERIFNKEQINKFINALSGSMTIEGAPHLLSKHIPVFDCANRCGRHGKRYINPLGHINMMAAIQPFLSGAISKTINLPSHATIQDIGNIYLTAWKYMLKAVAIYRDGSKMSQPMANNLDILEGLNNSEQDNTSSTDIIKSTAENMIRSYRKRLPNRRGGYTQSATIGGTKLYVRTGEYEDGTLGEIFLDIHKEGAGFRAVLNCFAIAVSMGLQRGVPLEEFCDAFLFTRFEPNGIVQGSDTVKFSTSLIDFIFRELAISYLGRYDLSQLAENELMQLTNNNNYNIKKIYTPLPSKNIDQQLIDNSQKKYTYNSNSIATQESKQKGYTGDPCPECGHLTMVRNGTCLKCHTCAATTGCS